MKKILSLLCAVAMLSSFAFTTVQAENTKPEMVAAIAEKLFYDKYSDHPQYEVTVSLKGFSEVGELENVGDDFDPGYKGNNILMTQGFMTYDQNKYTLMASYTEKVKANGTWTINTDTKGQIAFLWNTTTMEEMINTADTDLVKFYFVSRDAINKVPGAPVPDNENIVSFVSGDPSMSGKVDIATFNGGTTYTTDISYSSEDGTMVNVAKPLVEKAPVTHAVIDKTPCDTIPAVNGFYSKGFKVDITPNDDTITKVAYALACKDKTSLEKASGAWEGLTLTGASNYSFAINVLNIPDTIAAEDITNNWTVDVTVAE